MKKLSFFLGFLFLSFNFNAQVIFTSSFETWSNDIPTLPAGWVGSKTTLEHDTLQDSIIQVVTGAFHGSFACQLINTQSSHKRFTTEAMHADSGYTYNIQLRVKGAGNIRTGIYDKRSTASGYSSYNAYDSINSNNWVLFSQDVTCQYTSDSAEFILSVNITDSTMNHLMVDSVIITKLSIVTGENVTLAKSPFSVYPNPCVNYLNIQLSDERTNGEVKIYNIQGSLVYNSNLNTKNNKIDISTLNTGNYIVEISNNQIIERKRISVVK